MDGIAKKIPSVDVVNVNVIGVEPCHGPWVDHTEPKAAVLKTPRSAREIGAIHVKRVATAKAGAETIVGNPPASRLLRCALLLLRWPCLLLCPLLLLCWLRLLLRRPCLLRCALLLLRRLSLLLRRFGLLLCRFGLLLRRLLLFPAWCLRKSRSNRSGKQEKTRYG